MIDDGACLRAATVAGAGVAVHSLWSVRAELKAGLLKRVLPDLSVDDQSALWLIYPQANVLTLKVRAMMDCLLDRIGQLAAWYER